MTSRYTTTLTNRLLVVVRAIFVILGLAIVLQIPVLVFIVVYPVIAWFWRRSVRKLVRAGEVEAALRRLDLIANTAVTRATRSWALDRSVRLLRSHERPEDAVTLLAEERTARWLWPGQRAHHLIRLGLMEEAEAVLGDELYYPGPHSVFAALHVLIITGRSDDALALYRWRERLRLTLVDGLEIHALAWQAGMAELADAIAILVAKTRSRDPIARPYLDAINGTSPDVALAVQRLLDARQSAI